MQTQTPMAGAVPAVEPRPDGLLVRDAEGRAFHLSRDAARVLGRRLLEAAGEAGPAPVYQKRWG